jgi:hypothetical protein
MAEPTQIAAETSSNNNKKIDFHFEGILNEDGFIEVEAIPDNGESDYTGILKYPEVAKIKGRAYPISIRTKKLCHFKKVNYIQIPKNVSKFAYNPFVNSDALDGIIMDNDNPYMSQRDGIIYNKDFTSMLVCKCFSSKTYVPASLKRICSHAIKTVNEEKLIIPPSVEVLQTMFIEYSHSLKKIFVPSSVKTIENFAFEHIRNLETIYICVNTKLNEYSIPAFNNGKLKIIKYSLEDEANLLKNFNKIDGFKIESLANPDLWKLVGSIMLIGIVGFSLRSGYEWLREQARQKPKTVTVKTINTINPINQIKSKPDSKSNPTPDRIPDRTPDHVTHPTTNPYPAYSPYTSPVSTSDPATVNPNIANMYRSQYEEMCRQAERDYNSLTSMGSRYIDNGQISGATGRNDIHVAQQLANFRQLQHRMQQHRHEASINGVHIDASSWETVSVN